MSRLNRLFSSYPGNRKKHPSIWTDTDCYQWVLSEVVLYDQPITGVKGLLGLWNYEKPYSVVGSAELV